MSTRTPHTRHLAFALACALSLGAAADSRRAYVPPPSRAAAVPANALFSDDFSGDLASWAADREGVWKIVRGMLRAELPDKKQERSFLRAGSVEWTDYAVDVDVCMTRGVDKGVAVRVEGDQAIAVDLRGPGYQDVLLQRREWPLGRAQVANANSVWHHLRVEVVEHTYKVYVNGDLLIEREDGKRSRSRGRIALAAYSGGVAECTVFYDNVVVTPIGSSLFGQR
jgi:hypothetical protein